MGCSAIISSTTSNMADGLARAVAEQNDPETVRQGAPAYLLLIDGLIADDSGSGELLLTGAELYSTYAGAFVEDPERAKRLSLKARDYAWRGLCAKVRRTCDIWKAPYDRFAEVVATLGEDDVPALFTVAAAWTSWIQAHRDDWGAIADKARVDAMIQRVVALDPDYQDGMPFVYLGVLATLMPEALGGRPEEGRRDFERAIELSGGKALMAKVMYARHYARLTFDRDLHDRLCREVIEAEAEVPGLTLANTLAQEQARQLLSESEAYFEE
jgi:hypothetical protein